jgi:hypothetical protein
MPQTDHFTTTLSLPGPVVTERQGRTIVTLEVDGTFDRTGLPDPLVMDHDFKLAEGKIAELRIGFDRAR